jgi:hypothetical protein
MLFHALNEMDIWSKKWLMPYNPDKTEIMIFSNCSVPENLDFSFNGKSVPITTSHRHLGVTFSNDAKWNWQLPVAVVPVFVNSQFHSYPIGHRHIQNVV